MVHGWWLTVVFCPLLMGTTDTCFLQMLRVLQFQHRQCGPGNHNCNHSCCCSGSNTSLSSNRLSTVKHTGEQILSAQRYQSSAGVQPEMYSLPLYPAALCLLCCAIRSITCLPCGLMQLQASVALASCAPHMPAASLMYGTHQLYRCAIRCQPYR